MKLQKIFIWLLGAFFSVGVTASDSTKDKVTVQLQWVHQSQFAGIYVAEARKLFSNEGLSVTLLEGGIGINAIEQLQKGAADVAISSLALAWDTYKSETPVTNIAQIFEQPSLSLLCRGSKGVYTPNDIAGKVIGVYDESDKRVVIEMLKALKLEMSDVAFIKQTANALELVKGEVACATVMNYDEYWTVVEKGVPLSELLLITPNSLNVPAVEDGVYVRTEMLSDPVFREKMVRFLKALKEGWRETKNAPNFAIEAVMQKSPNLDKLHEQHEIETVLTLLPKNFSNFGYFDLANFDAEKKYLGRENESGSREQKIWTHRIWNQLQELDKGSTPITPAVKYYLENTTLNIYFKLLVFFGVFTYALSGVLEAIDRNYDMWGRLILAFMSGVGGGTLRDLIIGGDRIPFYYVKDFYYPLGIILVVLAASSLSLIYPNMHKTVAFKQVKKYADVFGFSALAIVGASIALVSNMPWYWAPVLAALTCAGGGMLRDIVINQEPATFKGVIYEEAAVVGAILLIMGLNFSGYFEHSPLLVYLSVALSFSIIVVLRILIYKFDIHYPRSLGGGSGGGH